MFNEIICPSCRREKGEAFNSEKINGVKWYFFLCKECGEEWQEELTFLSGGKDDPEKMKVDSLLLGIEIFEAVNTCLSSPKEQLRVLKELVDQLAEIENKWGFPRFKAVMVNYNGVDWALTGLDKVIEELDGESKKVASDLLHYLDDVANPLTSSFY